MRNVTIFYFSGTGNTAYVANQIGSAFSGKDSICQLVPMENVLLKRTGIDLENTDYVGIGFPVHAMDAPDIVYRFVDLLPTGNFKFFIFKTAGDPMLNGGSSYHLREKLRIKAWKCIYDSLFVMPSNVGNNPNPEMIKHLALIAVKHASKMVTDILTGKIVNEPKSNIVGLFRLFGKLESKGAKKNSDRWRVNEDCIHCGKCVSNCPTKNITSEGTKLVFGKTCIWCFRCCFHCPTQAIMMSKMFDKMRIKPYNIERILEEPAIRSDFFEHATPQHYVRFRKHFQELGLMD
ncbi:MAG: hypothetical protein CVU48_08135 [Candidatus Cloacimonetes bacterium HGW-Cloacimonetes-1]|jgi:ferredoxin|nr:MAG: hypothetical protein CVU48_08135 [Candidatus Cloacimonetes bacterium HGW-Cloacimonetes-1]